MDGKELVYKGSVITPNGYVLLIKTRIKDLLLP